MLCPNAIRVGTILAGGKFICNPFDLPDKCVVYSLGVGNNIDFETELQRITNERCEVDSFDRVLLSFVIENKFP